MRKSRTKPAGPEEELWSLGLAKQVPLQALITSERNLTTYHVETYEFAQYDPRAQP
jgi:hypothetical protein